MSIGNKIVEFRKEKQLTQGQLGELFHVTRQTVSNWENDKSYPDLHTLIDISNRFEISLDVLLKEDKEMMMAMDKELMLGRIKKEKSAASFFNGTGMGMVISCLYSPYSPKRTIFIVIGLIMLGIGWYKRSKYEKDVLSFIENE